MTLGGRDHGKRYDIAGHARFLTFSCYDRAPLFSDEVSRDRFAELLEITRNRHSILLLSWVLMPEHAHLCVVPPAPGVVRLFLKHLKGAVARHTLDAWRASHDPRLLLCKSADGASAFWQPGGGHDRLLRSNAEMREKIEYIHNNPVKRGLVALAAQWRWSSAAWYNGDQSAPVTIDRLPQ